MSMLPADCMQALWLAGDCIHHDRVLVLASAALHYRMPSARSYYHAAMAAWFTRMSLKQLRYASGFGHGRRTGSKDGLI